MRQATHWAERQRRGDFDEANKHHSALDVFKRMRCIASLLMRISWRLSGSAQSRCPPPSHAHLGLSFAFVHWRADVSAAVGGFVGGLAGPVDLAAYSVMHELQLCQRITSVAPWRCLLTPLSHPCLDTSRCLTIRSVSPIYKRANACGWIDLC
ncbi:hypothetical protein M441DRAFT_64015 [Trichoderma asperellum CBS 433.97]|uniref:Uncharacterized protein n=1 Tax=Trichoderma asperellum (strain ATCC 204424 / CBS 433.97 / NBRC 101777) TaxID=1042311 RepID=A0A2T3ZPL1_TRIA4|nr:hypothetical protein M441DRAFT_64015 [Trichoderma asperellum CBS 433.97]PTB46749.1 hypothetical protein M441DRAFT_64015 [Trichoderma asperellum CBS 433.97]